MDIKYIRKERGITQSELAAAVEIDQTTISKWENGHSKPTVATAKKIAEVLGFDWTEFFKEEI